MSTKHDHSDHQRAKSNVAGHADDDDHDHDHDHDHSTHDHGKGHSHGGHGHSHAGHNHLSGVTDQRRMGWAFVIIAAFMLVEVIGGVVSGSLALLADAGHMASDTLALAFSWAAIHYGKRPATGQMSFGYKRLEVLAAFVNGCALFVIAGWIVVEAVQRFAAPVPVLGKTMFIVAVVGLLANIGAFAVLHGGNRENLNMRGAWLHVMGDMLGSIAAIVAALVILGTGWTPIDPLLSIFVAVIILKSAWGIVKSSARILLEGTPEGMSLADIKADLEQNVVEVSNAHHIHAWSITGEQHLVTLHVHPASGTTARDVVIAVQQRLATKFNIQHVTVQVEDEQCVDAHSSTGVGHEAQRAV
ncbi:cation diffusion facilitator family transporter [Caballeronia sp. LZ062]|uniref:cation diffusion facilitator family transporter n=1 Tax=unclassified Caballeronia TaxID=2646786 RepID=UPI0028663B3F|nr:MULTISPECIES: cation diffusion facilitator family transporter [unclassified Caballeronia]MDR5855767.1 cation diffusion facilitator family transporter [Caballeronia sp. LZ050]MDR5872446.1 cation diffusion facilitator family transporter [Caballeronia sp. LZ062]